MATPILQVLLRMHPWIEIAPALIGIKNAEVRDAI